MMPVRLYVEPHSAVRAHVVLRRGLRTLAVLGTWTPLHGWDLTAAGCQAALVARVLPAVLARQGVRAEWYPRGEAGAAPWDGNKRVGAGSGGGRG